MGQTVTNQRKRKQLVDSQFCITDQLEYNQYSNRSPSICSLEHGKKFSATWQVSASPGWMPGIFSMAVFDSYEFVRCSTFMKRLLSCLKWVSGPDDREQTETWQEAKVTQSVKSWKCTLNVSGDWKDVKKYILEKYWLYLFLLCGTNIIITEITCAKEIFKNIADTESNH